MGIFPNEAAITRLVGALLLEQNDEWQLQRRYMQLEGLQTLDRQSTRSAVRSGQLSTSPIEPEITTRTPRPGTRSERAGSMDSNGVVSNLDRKLAWLDHGTTKSGEGRGIPLNADA